MCLFKKTKDNCIKVLQKVKCGAYCQVYRLKNDTQAMGTIEVVLIVAVLVALALLFKEFITGFAGDIFTGIKNSTSGIF